MIPPCLTNRIHIFDPGPLNITFGSDMPITFLHLMLMSKIYVVNSDMKNVIGMSDLNVMSKGPGPLNKTMANYSIIFTKPFNTYIYVVCIYFD